MSVGIPARSIANVGAAARRVCQSDSRRDPAGVLTIGNRVIAQIPLAALAGVIWMGARLLDWSTWKRLHVMRRVDAAAFLVTAVCVC